MDAAEQTDLGSGTMVDHFKVVRLVGRGGMGEVYLARDTKLGRKVALKLVRPESLGNEQAVQRFLHEARTTAKFSHPHIVQVHAVGEHEARPYVALEYLEGETLRERMDQRRLSPKETIRIGLAIAEALAEAHKHGVLHRDLKPENVVIPSDGRLRVVDFGLAKHISEKEALATADTTELGSLAIASTLAETFKSKGGLMGTPLYMAPEQWAEEDVTSAIDMWALGVMLYELLSGQHPYEECAIGRKLFVLAARVCSDAPVPELAAPAAPAKLHELTTRALAKDPDVRPTAGDMVERLSGLLHRGRDRLDDDQSPFRGLLPFTEEHAELFFGRDAEVAQFVERLRHEPILPVVGPSGAGKSSFVQAGVIPRLLEQDRWLILKMRPGRKPFDTLVARLVRGHSTGPTERSGPRSSQRAVPSSHNQGEQEEDLQRRLETSSASLGLELARLSAQHGAPVLLFVDQLEELYTLVDDESVRLSFMEAICQAADDAEGPIRVVMTLRDDFLGRMAQGEVARAALSRVTTIRSPGPELLEETLREPVRAVDYEYDDSRLVTEMVTAVRGEPAALPLLQFTGQVLWERRDADARKLLRSEYDAVGGVEGALARQADAVLEGMSSEQLRTARDLMLRLVTPEGTRRVVLRADVLEGLGAGAGELLDRLIQERTLSTRKGKTGAEVELVHESLIRSWEQLARWIDESREEIAFLAEATQAAELWDRRGRRPDELWQDDALRAAQLKLAALKGVPQRVRDFVGEGALLTSRAARRRRATLVGAFVLLTAMSVGAAFAALEYRGKERRAQEDRGKAEQGQAAALRMAASGALDRRDALEARAEVRMSLERHDDPRTRALWWQLKRVPLRRRWRGSSNPATVSFAPSGTTIAMGGGIGMVSLLDVTTGGVTELREASHGAGQYLAAVAFSPDGQSLAARGDRGLLLWGVRQHAGHRPLIEVPAPPRMGQDQLRFSPDGRQLAVLHDAEVELREPSTGEVVRTLNIEGCGIRSAAFAPRGSVLAIACGDGSVRLWDTREGAELRVFRGHTGRVHGVAISPDGALVASGGIGGRIMLWDARTGAQRGILSVDGEQIYDIAFSPRGRLLASCSAHPGTRIWDLSSGRLSATLGVDDGACWRLTFSPDGTLLATTYLGGQAALWRMVPAPATRDEGGPSQRIVAGAVGAESRIFASGGLGGELWLWDATTGRAMRELRGHEDHITAVDIDPTGKRLLSGSADKSLRVWDLETGRSQATLRGPDAEVTGAVFSPDGATIASVSYDNSLRIWSSTSGAQRKRIDVGGNATAVALRRDGTRAVVGMSDGSIAVWDIRADGKLDRRLGGHQAWVQHLAIGPNDRWLASASVDGSVRLVDLTTGDARLLVEPASSLRIAPVPVFHPDGRRLFAAGWSSTHAWDLSTGEEAEHSLPKGMLVPTPNGLAVLAVDAAIHPANPRKYELATGRPLWSGMALTADPPQALTHEGWIDLRSGKPDPKVSESRWRQAVQKRANAASVSEDGAVLCLHGLDGRLEVWDLRRDRIAASHSVGPEQGEPSALAEGCVEAKPTADGNQLLLYRLDGSVTHLQDRIVGWDVVRDQIYASADDNSITAYDRTGARLWTRPAHRAAGTVIPVGDDLALGYPNGEVEIIPRSDQSPQQLRKVRGTASANVYTMRPGPAGTLVAGYSNGFVGVWLARTGERLIHLKLRGVVHTIRVHAGSVYAITNIGDYVALDLSVLDSDYCELMQQVWEEVPVTWRDGRAVLEPPPKDHECSPK